MTGKLSIEEQVRTNMHPVKHKGYIYDILADGKLYRIKEEDTGRTWITSNGEIITGWEEVK